jgi:hypothetical protein
MNRCTKCREIRVTRPLGIDDAEICAGCLCDSILSGELILIVERLEIPERKIDYDA